MHGSAHAILSQLDSALLLGREGFLFGSVNSPVPTTQCLHRVWFMTLSDMATASMSYVLIRVQAFCIEASLASNLATINGTTPFPKQKETANALQHCVHPV